MLLCSFITIPERISETVVIELIKDVIEEIEECLIECSTGVLQNL